MAFYRVNSGGTGNITYDTITSITTVHTHSVSGLRVGQKLIIVASSYMGLGGASVNPSGSGTVVQKTRGDTTHSNYYIAEITVTNSNMNQVRMPLGEAAGGYFNSTLITIG